MTDLLTISIAIIAMLLMASGIIFFVVMYQRRVIRHQEEINNINKQKELELVQAAVRGEEQERTRIASELHDDVGATLASVKLFLHSQNKELGDRPVFAQSRDLIDETIEKVRGLSHRLQPAVLKQFGLDAALSSFFKTFKPVQGLNIQYHNGDLPRMNEDRELALYRIVQELVNNTLKHSGASRIRCETYVTTDGVGVEYAHDGEGLTEVTFQQLVYKKDAIGLKNIVTRLKSVNGTISFERKGDLYLTLVNIPL